MKVANILIAEDDSVLREVYSKKFTISGYNIRAVENGAEAIKEAMEVAPDIMIIDLNMPVVDGFAVLEKFPKEKRKFPIIVLTNFGNEENRDRALKLGANEYFIKNEMTIRSLLEMVENLLKAKEMWDK
ncbi:MAG: response regulator [Candidatus Peribacteraceae bacterium]|mgnify:CR=1 FL=1|jgi:DNA-binding response OmpR family regulator|nr:response regulator [Candidatus Peribacteraceae bacterium]MDP7454770.1 response regulator [Candidatus Peribacteraceae bacterium]MDP7645775.1 response regulator [Candidatus Peribacteraceae bacterium]HJN88676.1 response regulator [Dehalococcoidia bacterium]|tara:strand:+ start:4536 stop:4922 length:387 start_codon:yes stop_codon:yes gene_type:complete